MEKTNISIAVVFYIAKVLYLFIVKIYNPELFNAIPIRELLVDMHSIEKGFSLE